MRSTCLPAVPLGIRLPNGIIRFRYPPPVWPGIFLLVLLLFVACGESDQREYNSNSDESFQQFEADTSLAHQKLDQVRQWRSAGHIDSALAAAPVADSLFTIHEIWDQATRARHFQMRNLISYGAGRDSVTAQMELALDAHHSMPYEERDEGFLGLIYHRYGRFLHSRNQYREAGIFMNKAVEYAEAYRDPESALVQSTNMAYGLHLLRVNDFHGAIEQFTKVRELYDRRGEDAIHSGRAAMHNNMAIAYVNLKDLTRAAEHYQRSLSISRELFGPKHPRTVRVLFNLSRVYRDKHEYDEALSTARQAFEGRKAELGADHPNTQRVKVRIAGILTRKGNYQEARDLLVRSIPILKEDSESQAGFLAEAHSYLQQIHQSKAQWNKALEAGYSQLSIAGDYFPPDHMHALSALNLIADTYYQSGDFQSAVETFRKAISRNNSVIKDSGGYEMAARDGGTSDFSRLIISLHGKGKSLFAKYEHSGDAAYLNNALSAYDAALTNQWEIRTHFSDTDAHLALSDFLDDKAEDIYNAIYAFAEKFPNEVEARLFSIMQQHKAIVTSAAITSGNQQPFSATARDTGRLERLREVRTRLNIELARLNNAREDSIHPERVSGIQHAYETVTLAYYDEADRIKELNPDSGKLHGFRHELTPEELRSKLPEGTLILDYFLGEDYNYITYITGEETGIQRVSTRFDLAEAAVKFADLASRRTLIRDSERNIFRELNSDLYQALIAPVAPAINQAGHLVILPHRELFHVPFAALFNPEHPADNFSDKPYLLRSHSISTNYSLSLAYNRFQREADPEYELDYAAFAPIFDQQDHTPVKQEGLLAYDQPPQGLYRSVLTEDNRFAYLPGTEEEVAYIDQLMRQSGKSSRVFQRSEATQNNLSGLTSARYVHFATHSLFNHSEPALSGLILSRDDSSGPYHLTSVEELSNLRLNAELVYLSSCESGLGKLFGSEGMISLNRTFMSAGAQNVIYTLWPVVDRSTQNLSIRMFEYLLDGQAPSEALRNAQLNLLEQSDTSLPVYWSGFQVAGM